MLQALQILLKALQKNYFWNKYEFQRKCERRKRRYLCEKWLNLSAVDVDKMQNMTLLKFVRNWLKIVFMEFENEYELLWPKIITALLRLINF